MKPYILLLALSAVAITSCTSAYKSGQTPDDVYFSPQREQSEYVAVNKDDDSYYNGDDYYSDRQLRMKVQNRNQWSNLDDWYYNSDRYNYSYYDGFYGNNPWTASSYWNYNYNPYYSSFYSPFYYSSYNYFNPYYSPVYVVYGKTNNYPAYSNRPRMFNLNTYNRQLTNSNNYVTRRIDLNAAPAAGNNYRYNNNYNNSRRSAGDYLRNSFNNNNSSSNISRPSSNNNSSSPSSSGRSSSSGSSSSGGSAPVRRF